MVFDGFAFDGLQLSIDKKLNIWKDKNASQTKTFCMDLLKDLKMRYLDPVIARVGCKGGASVTYSSIMDAWNAIVNDFHQKAVGSKVVIAVIFKEFNKVRWNLLNPYLIPGLQIELHNFTTLWHSWFLVEYFSSSCFFPVSIHPTASSFFVFFPDNIQSMFFARSHLDTSLYTARYFLID